MRRLAVRSRLVGIASLVLAAGLAGCGGGTASTGASTSTQGAGAILPAQASSMPFGLGLVSADPNTIAQLTHIRRALSLGTLPAAVNLAPEMPPVGNQGQEGSCASWATAYAMRGYEARQDVWSSIAPKTTAPALNFSPAFIYNQINGGRDGGSTIPGALTVLQKKGAATLADMPYLAGQYTTQPTAAAFADAAHYRLSSYGYIAPTDLPSIKAQIASGLPVILAIKVYTNFFALGNNAIYTGIAGAYAGGHAVTVVGYDDAKQAVEIMNSWGTGWGTGGFGWISYAALNQVALEAYSAIDDHGMPPVPAGTATPAPQPTAPPSTKPTSAPQPTPLPSAKPTPVPVTPKPSPLPSAKPSQTPATPKPTPTATPIPR